MLSLNGTPIGLKSLNITASQKLAGKDMSGQSARTDQAEQGDKAKTIQVNGSLSFHQAALLSQLFELAGAKTHGARTVYRIHSRTTKALGIKQVKFQGNLSAKEDKKLRQWQISFELVECHSIAEKRAIQSMRHQLSSKMISTFEYLSNTLNINFDINQYNNMTPEQVAKMAKDHQLKNQMTATHQTNREVNDDRQ